MKISTSRSPAVQAIETISAPNFVFILQQTVLPLIATDSGIAVRCYGEVYEASLIAQTAAANNKNELI
jgi:hypothetical protein